MTGKHNHERPLRRVLSVLGWIAAFYVAQWYAPHAATLLPLQSASEPVRYATYTREYLGWGVFALMAR